MELNDWRKTIMLFVDALKNMDHEALKKACKSDLHNHIDLGGSFDYVSDRKSGLILPADTYQGVRGMDNDFLKHFLPQFPTANDLMLLWKAALIEARENGVYTLAPNIGKCMRRKFGDIQTGMAAFDTLARSIYEDDYFMLRIKPDFTIKRGCDLGEAAALVDEVIESGCFSGLDLIGPEDYSPELLVPIYEKARKHGFTLKAHVGEYTSPENVRAYIETLPLDELQHGIAIAQSPKLMEMVRDRNMILNVCPTSNVKLGYVDSYKNHPIKQLVENGINVTINTDDRIVFGSSVTDEYAKLFQSGCLTAEQLNDIRLFGLLYKEDDK